MTVMGSGGKHVSSLRRENLSYLAKIERDAVKDNDRRITRSEE